MRKWLCWLFIILMLTTACARTQQAGSTTDAGTKEPAPPLTEEKVLVLLQQYASEGRKALDSGLIVGQERQFVEGQKRSLESGSSPKLADYYGDLTAGGGKARIAVWTPKELFAVLQYKSGFTGKPSSMKWHLVQQDGQWRIENHGDLPDGPWWGWFQLGIPPEYVRPDSTGATPQGLKTGMPAENAAIVYGSPTRTEPGLLVYDLAGRAGTFTVKTADGRITGFSVQEQAKPAPPPPVAGATELPAEQKATLEALGRKVWGFVGGGDRAGLTALLAEPAVLEISAQGVSGAGREYEKGVEALLKWGQSKAKGAVVTSVSVGQRKSHSIMDVVRVESKSGILYVYVRIKDGKIQKLIADPNEDV